MTEPDAGGSFVVVDLDNQLGDNFDPARPTPYPPEKMRHLLAEIERQTRMRIARGFAAMNEVTARAISSETRAVLTEKRIEVKIVPVRREEADKHIFMAIGLAVGKFPAFVVCSLDKGYVEAVLKIRDYDQTSPIYVAVDKATHRLMADYGRAEGVSIIEVNPRPAPAPAPRPTPGGPRPRVAPLPPPVAAPIPAEAPTAVGYVLICDLCGRRCLQSSAAKRDLCKWCGSPLRTDQTTAGIVPAGKRPYTDGPVVEIWYRGSHKRTAVLCEQTTVFGRDARYSTAPAFVPLGDLVDEKNKISREQFSVADHGGRRYFLFRPSRIEDGKERTKRMAMGPDKREVETNKDVELSNGTVFWVNRPDRPDDAGALLRCVFRTVPPNETGEGDE